MRSCLPLASHAIWVSMLLQATTSAGEPEVARYRSWLLELGAVPVEEMPKRPRRPSKHAIVHGWVNPRYADSDYYVPKEVREKFGIPKPPLTYERYVSFLAVEEYKKNRSPELYAAILFSLEQMRHGIIRVKDERDILRVYEAGIGVEDEAIDLLRGAVPATDEVRRLLDRHADPRLICLLRAPEPDDKEYIGYLVRWSNNDVLTTYGRFQIKRLLAKGGSARSATDFRNFAIQNVGSVRGWWQRLQMYEALVVIGDNSSWAAVNKGLLHDPVTETREQVLALLRRRPDSVENVLDTVVLMTEGKGAEHRGGNPCRPAFGGYGYSLAQYLKWASTLQGLDQDARNKIATGIDNLKANPLTPGRVPSPGPAQPARSRAEINPK